MGLFFEHLSIYRADVKHAIPSFREGALAAFLPLMLYDNMQDLVLSKFTY